MDAIPIGQIHDVNNAVQKFDKNVQKDGANFKETISKYVNEVNDLQLKAGESIENFAAGKVENLHEVMIAMSKAEVSFKFMMETRNKLVDAYNEIMKMQV